MTYPSSWNDLEYPWKEPQVLEHIGRAVWVGIRCDVLDVRVIKIQVAAVVVSWIELRALFHGTEM